MSADPFVGTPGLAAAEADRRRQEGPIRRLWWRMCLKPYGEALCTPGAAFWIFSARVAIFVMAAAEAVSWSYLGYYIGQSSQPYVTAGLAGLAIFSVIWIVDASFITLDTAHARDQAALLGRPASRRAERMRLVGGLLIRGAIISATLYISAPFLAQLVFYRDISAEMARQDAALIARARSAYAATFDQRASDLRTLKANLDVASIEEAAGAGPSRRVGRGPVVATIERRIADVDQALAALAQERDEALRAFDALSREELQQRYGLQFVEDGIRTRARILGTLQQNDAYANAELAIRAFLAFLFLALVVLKLFQPASVRVYFSETLQDLNQQYRAGAFDAWLPPAERSYGRAALTPLRFEAWACDHYPRIRSEEESDRRAARLLSVRSSREGDLRAMRAQADAEAAPLRHEAAAMAESIAANQHEIASVSGELAALEARLDRQQASIQTLQATMRGGIGGDAFVRAAEAHESLLRESEKTRASIRERQATLDRLQREEASRTARLGTLHERLAAREAVVKTFDDQLARMAGETSAALGATMSGAEATGPA